ncbi:hypothetical protein QFX18_19320 [Saccharophagus degradans]|uniref:hypothetical protein n=1 Tax=Saccharophagus degradans TaxID=86304 RepID=UPI002477D901|nr:hypothetical protein [Saccharophagus degradans]WGO98161.1 hypothetical protein QFX18_19320 [Saccharophagus degradans]
MNKLILILISIFISSCDWTVKEKFEDGTPFEFIVDEKFMFYRWENISENLQYSRLERQLKNPIYLCVADSTRKSYREQCEKNMIGGIEFKIARYPSGTKVRDLNSGLVIEWRGLGNLLKGPSPSKYYKVEIEGEILWVPSYMRFYRK